MTVMQPGRCGINDDGKNSVTMTQVLQGQQGALAGTCSARLRVMERSPQRAACTERSRARPGHLSEPRSFISNCSEQNYRARDISSKTVTSRCLPPLS